MKFPSQYRIRTGPMASTDQYGNNGAFSIPLSIRSTAYVIASDGHHWEHVSVHIVSDGKVRTPTWAEMCKIKDLFWEHEDTVIQFHPPKSNYINNHPHTLHLWKPVNMLIPLPDTILV